MTDKTLVSMENVVDILTQVVNNIKGKISNKDISLPYTSQLNKSTFIKVDGDGSMYLSNNGSYINLGNINKSNLDIAKIYEIFNIKTSNEHWDNTGIVNMPIPKAYFTSQVYNGKIYCIGGYSNDSTITNTLEIYNIVNNTWTTGNPMITARNALTSVIYNSKIYCIGGYGSSYLNTVEIYDIVNNTWTTGTPITTARDGLTSQLYNGKIYCIGGYNGAYTNKVEILSLSISNYTLNLPSIIQDKLNKILNESGSVIVKDSILAQ